MTDVLYIQLVHLESDNVHQVNDVHDTVCVCVCVMRHALRGVAVHQGIA